ncbi:esterase B1-like [Musca autumnalis]|uniref:esterase B1-like n=1 Tax=Musca autumnalis TaxID=221902 RepID=UPI003CEB680C
MTGSNINNNNKNNKNVTSKYYLTNSKALPVMVWIYGGGFQFGEASRDIYAPAYFMQRDVVQLTFVYRLGVFGEFLSLDDPDLQIPGNVGLKVQTMYRMACHIGYKATVHRYLAKQRRRRVVLKDRSLLTKEEQFINLLFAFGPAIEPYESEECVINGANPHAKNTISEFLHLMTERTFWHGIHRAIKARTAYAGETPTYYYRFDFDSKFFNHFRNLKCGRSVKGVCHADEISYLFYNINAEKLSPTTREYKCIQRMVGMWYNFALSSNPNCKEVAPTKWEPVNVGSDLRKPLKLLNINDEIPFMYVPINDKLSVWDSLYTKEYLY